MDEGSGSETAEVISGNMATIDRDVVWGGSSGVTKYSNPHHLIFGASSTNDHVLLPHAPLSIEDMQAGFSLAAWVYYTGGNNRTILAGDGDGTGEEGCYVLRVATRQLHFLYHLGGPIVHSPGVMITQSEWSHVGVAYDGATLRFFVNGAFRASSELILSDRVPPYFRIGFRQSSAQVFSGGIDEVRVFARTLMAAEFETLAAGGPLARRYDPFRSHAFHSHRIGGLA